MVWAVWRQGWRASIRTRLMSQVKTIIDACETDVPLNSGFGISSITISATFAQNSTIPGNPPESITSSGSRTWTRKEFKRRYVESGEGPGADEFYLVQFSCCCPCGYVFCNDGRGPAEVLAQGFAGAFTLDLTGTATAGGGTNPYTGQASVLLWPIGSTPCKNNSQPPRGDVSLLIAWPAEFFRNVGSGGLTSNVAANYYPSGGAAYDIVLTGLNPCGQGQEYGIADTRMGSYEGGGSYTATCTMGITIA